MLLHRNTHVLNGGFLVATAALLITLPYHHPATLVSAAAPTLSGCCAWGGECAPLCSEVDGDTWCHHSSTNCETDCGGSFIAGGVPTDNCDADSNGGAPAVSPSPPSPSSPSPSPPSPSTSTTAAGGGDFTSAQYSDALHTVTKFYGAQRSGTLTQNWLLMQYPESGAGATAGQGACFTRDGKSYDPAADFSGGWHDAGDNIKFTNTIAWAAYVLLKSYDAYPAAHKDIYDDHYNAVGDTVPDVLNEVKWATDYLMRIHNIGTGALVSQIGDARDHDNGLTCPTMTQSGTSKGGDDRTVWFGRSKTDSGTAGTKADVLGITAATLALMATVYAPFDAEYATSCTEHAKVMYTTAKQRPGVTAEPAGQSYYAGTSYVDDLACAAIELHRATGRASYGSEAVAHSKAVGAHNWVVDWGQHVDLCRHSMAVAGFASEVKSHWGAAVDSYKAKVVSKAGSKVNGLAFFGDWGSLRYAANAAFSAALYASAFADEPESKPAMAFARSQADYILGANDYKRSFIVGWGTNPPTRPHHKNAYGKDEWFGTDSVPLYSLAGALVGGPHTNSYSDAWLTSPPGYQDSMGDYIANEVTIDYSAGLVGVLAAFGDLRGSDAGGPSPPTPPPPAATGAPTEDPQSTDGPDVGDGAGGADGAADDADDCAGTCGAAIFTSQRRGRRPTDTHSGPQLPTNPPIVTADAGGGGGGGDGGCADHYAQCDGIGYNGPTCCLVGTCVFSSDYYSQCK